MVGDLIRADVYRKLGYAGPGGFVKLMCRDRTFRPVVTLRLYHFLRQHWSRRPASLFVGLMHRMWCHSVAMELPLSTVIGPGFSIAHGWGMVINAHAKIGRNVTIFHGVTIGQGDRIASDGTRRTGYPVIGDNVWIGPGATIVGAVTVGDGSRIMAGAVVSFDVPPGSMVRGNPGEIWRENCVMDVMHRVI